ncbi:MAG: alginate lyase family protein [Candidatus Hydrogenedentes bacterium]|nr:alginate lyase family protein [Candidatus Hydrogenedentota bacterium]
MNRIAAVIILVMIACVPAVGAQETLVDLVRRDPGRIQRLFEQLDLGRADLAGVRDAVTKGDWTGACEALLLHYREGANPVFSSHLPPVERDDAVIARAGAVLKDTFTFYDQTGTAPRRADGGLQWDYTGPENDKEWAWALNRHFHLGWLLEAYAMTGDTKYAAAWDAHVRDWILQNPFAEPNANPLVWRGLETFFRVRAWAAGFHALQRDPAFTPVTRILLLSSIPDHARYLRNFHKETSNWIAMELNGLASAGIGWPEFKEAAGWVDYGVARLTEELAAQVYPDGAQMELTSHYHRVTLNNFQAITDLMRKAGREAPPAFSETVARMWDYLAYTLNPQGYSPLNNDSDLDRNGPGVLAMAESLGRPDWTWIASNGARGTQPEGLPSRVFPWAGQLVMRSGWDRDAQWAFFDAGPMGIGHYHADKLHVSVSAHGRDILVDGGRYSYVGGRWREYFTGSASHNVILVDGKGQAKHPLKAEAPVAQQFVTHPDYDLGYGNFDSGFAGVEGCVGHERLVYYKRGAYWIVVDRITTDRPQSLSALWHFHPECAVGTEGQTVASTDAGQGNVRIVPAIGTPWELSVIKGQEAPVIQGWWSREYNHKAPAPTAIYSQNVEQTSTFAWLIVPAKGMPPEAQLRMEMSGDTADCDVTIGATHETVRLTVSARPGME